MASSSSTYSSCCWGSSSSSSSCCWGPYFEPRLFPDTLCVLDAEPTHPSRQIVDAALKGDIVEMKKLVKRRKREGKSVAVVEELKDPQKRRSLGIGALHVAAYAGEKEMCKHLIKKVQLDVNAAAEHGLSPLIFAIYGQGRKNVVNLLLDRGADPNIATEEGFTVLHVLATKQDPFETAVLLLSRKTNVDSMSTEGTPLHFAAQCGNVGMMEALLKYNADPNKLVQGSYAPLTLALFASSLKCVELLIQAGADVNTGRPVTPLIIAARAGLADCINCLLKAGADPNYPDEIGRMPVEIAAIHGWKECVEILLPVTSRVATFADWTTDGIMQHVKSGSSEGHLHKSENPASEAFQVEGDAAFQREDYVQASTLYTKIWVLYIETVLLPTFGSQFLYFELFVHAMETGHKHSNLYAKRCLCWLQMGDKDKALDDANTCKNLGLYVSIRCHEQGTALLPTVDYGQACGALISSLKP
uniref:Uncharacterized protein n=1 Tax=Avena sativa TaxID=4498 RepID=A0ACD5XQP9_AVESA